MLTDRQKLTLIDGMCLAYSDGDESHKSAKKILDHIYRIAHPSERCPHPKWEEETLKLAESLKETIVDVWAE